VPVKGGVRSCPTVTLMPRRNGPGIALLADPTRLRIIALIALRPRRPSAIASELDISRSAATRHLRILAEAGLVVIRSSVIDGRWRSYAVAPDRHGAITAWLAGTRIGIDGATGASRSISHVRRSRPPDS
jgi:DNA-binding transcriptional ArsR family regulator